MTTLDEAPSVDLHDVLERYDVVGIGEQAGREYMVVSPKQLAAPSASSSRTSTPVSVDMREIGSSSPSPFTSWIRQEYNPDLMGLHGLMMYDKMRRNDGTVRGTLRLVKTPVLSANWFVEPASDRPKDKKIANFVWQNLTNWMSMSWPQFLTESLLMLDFGYYMFEKVFARGEDVTNDPIAQGKIVWKKMAPRHPMDVKIWEFDANGGPLSVWMYAESANLPGLQGGLYSMGGIAQYEVEIPISKLVVFSFDKEAGDIEGISVLRSAYKHWYYKDNLYKIDAIQKERHGIGIPVITLPVNFSTEDKRLADELGRNLRTNERAHVVLPPMWTLQFATISTQPVDALKSAIEHDKQIHANILAPFLSAASTTKEEDQAMFLKGTRFIADVVLETMNKYAIPELVDINFGKAAKGYPRLRARRIGEQGDWRTMSFAIRNYVGAGVIVPDDPLEDAVRDEMGLPPVDVKTARTEIHTPQLPGATHPYERQPLLKPGDPGYQTPPGFPVAPPAPGSAGGPPLTPPAPPKVGLPRQSAPSAKPPNRNAGKDSSGGK